MPTTVGLSFDDVTEKARKERAEELHTRVQNREELRFWEQVYLQVIASNNSDDATYLANRAVARRRKQLANIPEQPYR